MKTLPGRESLYEYITHLNTPEGETVTALLCHHTAGFAHLGLFGLLTKWMWDSAVAQCWHQPPVKNPALDLSSSCLTGKLQKVSLSAAPPALCPELLFPSAWAHLSLGSHPQLTLPALAAAITAFPRPTDMTESWRGPYACHTASPWSSINPLCRQDAWLVAAMSLPLWEGFSWISIRVNQLTDLIQLCMYHKWPCFIQ